MAVFNPSPGQPNDPNYLNYSRVTPQPEADTSKKISLSTTGEGILDATRIADTGIKDYIHDTTYSKVDTERDQFTAGLQKIKSQLDNGVIPNATSTVGGTSTGSWLDSNASADEPDLPTGLESGLSRMQQLTLAKQSGSAKLNDTQYSGNVLAIAKQLRSQFPGYRDYIDQEVSKASGLPVANAYYMNMMMDINRQMAQMGKQKDDQGHLMITNLDVPHMDTFITQRTNNDPKYPGDAYVLHQISSWQNLKSQQGIDAAKRAESTDDHNTQVQTESQNLTRNLNNMVSHHVSDNLALSGMPDLRSLTTYFSDLSAGKYPQATQAEVLQRSQQLDAYRNYLFQEGVKMAQGPGAVIGMDKAVKAVNDSLAPIDAYVSLVNDKDHGSGAFALHQVEAIKADAERSWLISHDTGPLSQQLLGARGVVGDQLAPQVIGPILERAQDKPFADRFAQEAISSIVPLNDARGQPIPRYMGDVIKDAKDYNNNQRDPSKKIPEEFNGTVVQWANQIANPELPLAAKDRLVDWAFSPKGTPVLDQLRMDYRDPTSGQMVDGKYRAFNIMTSPAMAQSISETARVHPENYQKFRNWTESNFDSLYRQDLQTLNKVISNPDLKVHFSFDDTTNRFGLVDQDGRPVTKQNVSTANIYAPMGTSDKMAIKNTTDRYVQSLFDTLDRVNGGIGNLSNVQKYDPQGQSAQNSTAKYLLDTVDRAFNENRNNMAAQAMGRAIIKAKNPDIENEELNKRFLGGTPNVNTP